MERRTVVIIAGTHGPWALRFALVKPAQFQIQLSMRRYGQPPCLEPILGDFPVSSSPAHIMETHSVELFWLGPARDRS